MRYINGLIGIILLASLCGACNRSVFKRYEITGYFKPVQIGDTLSFNIHQTAYTPGDSIPFALFSKEVEDSLRQKIDYLLEPGGTQLRPLGRFSINQQYEAYWFDLHLSWFSNQFILLYDKRAQAFTKLITVAEFYGGDGGQILRQSWGIHLHSATEPSQIVIRDSQHAMIIIEGKDDPVEKYIESATLLEWQDNDFRELTIQDTMKLIRQFPVQWD